MSSSVALGSSEVDWAARAQPDSWSGASDWLGLYAAFLASSRLTVEISWLLCRLADSGPKKIASNYFRAYPHSEILKIF